MPNEDATCPEVCDDEYPGFRCPGSQCTEDYDCFSSECNVEEAVCLGDAPEEAIDCIPEDDMYEI